VTSPYDDTPAMASARANLDRAQRLRGFAKDATTSNLRMRLLAVARECEQVAGQNVPEPRFKHGRWIEHRSIRDERRSGRELDVKSPGSEPHVRLQGA